MNDEGVCRTAPATPGLLNIYEVLILHDFSEMSENFVSLNEKVRTPEDSVKYLQDKGIVKTETVCSKCERVVSKMSKKKNFYFFRCLWCQTVESIRSGTFLYGKGLFFPCS